MRTYTHSQKGRASPHSICKLFKWLPSFTGVLHITLNSPQVISVLTVSSLGICYTHTCSGLPDLKLQGCVLLSTYLPFAELSTSVHWAIWAGAAWGSLEIWAFFPGTLDSTHALSSPGPSSVYVGRTSRPCGHCFGSCSSHTSLPPHQHCLVDSLPSSTQMAMNMLPHCSPAPLHLFSTRPPGRPQRQRDEGVTCSKLEWLWLFLAESKLPPLP